jgi:hypothetical protein
MRKTRTRKRAGGGTKAVVDDAVVAETANAKTDEEEALAGEMALCAADPYRFVLVAFEWGKGELSRFKGPEMWQADLLRSVRDGLLSPGQAIQQAVASGHGIGKSALVAWIILWAMCTKADTMGVVTANTETQLRTKTWPQLIKWHRQCIARHWFKVTSTAIFAADPGHERTWRMDAVPWSESNTEAFAGLHNQGKRIVLIFDEASAIPDVIWEVGEGALTDQKTEILWLVFGNPTRNSGRFRECFGRFRHRWVGRTVDSRDVALTNKTQIARWVEDYGEDSDFVRVRVRGVFPRAGAAQFIDGETVTEASRRDLPADPTAPVIMGVDVARFGDDQTVIVVRQGRRLPADHIRKYRNRDTVDVSGFVTEAIRIHNPDAVFVDGGGVGGGVVDQLRRLGHDVFDINFGAKAIDIAKYFNKRAEMWGLLRDWLKAADIPDDADLITDLSGPEYGFSTDGRIQLERKPDMKKRGLASPDVGDALALTFAFPVGMKRTRGPLGDRSLSRPKDYRPFG